MFPRPPDAVRTAVIPASLSIRIGAPTGFPVWPRRCLRRSTLPIRISMSSTRLTPTILTRRCWLTSRKARRRTCSRAAAISSHVGAEGLSAGPAPLCGSRPRPLDDQRLGSAQYRALFTRSGAQFALPKYHGALALFYNKDLFDRYGVPYPDSSWTHDDYTRAMLSFVKEQTRTGEQNLWGSMVDISWERLQVHANGWGGHFVDPAGSNPQPDGRTGGDGGAALGAGPDVG